MVEIVGILCEPSDCDTNETYNIIMLMIVVRITIMTTAMMMMLMYLWPLSVDVSTSMGTSEIVKYVEEAHVALMVSFL